MKNKVLDVINSRVSCREYSDKKVSPKKLAEILKAGSMAPSAKNRQIANILVLKSRGNVAKMRDLAIKEMGRDVFYGANVLVLVYAPKDDKFCYQDCSCILENMFVAANALGIQSCWINQVNDLLATPNGIKLKKKLEIPEDACIVGTCILGYAKEGVQLISKERKADFIKIK